MFHPHHQKAQSLVGGQLPSNPTHGLQQPAIIEHNRMIVAERLGSQPGHQAMGQPTSADYPQIYQNESQMARGQVNTNLFTIFNPQQQPQTVPLQQLNAHQSKPGGHKKSNSMANSKMAQIILRAPQQLIVKTQAPSNQQHQYFMQSQLLQYQQQPKNHLNLTNSIPMSHQTSFSQHPEAQYINQTDYKEQRPTPNSQLTQMQQQMMIQQNPSYKQISQLQNQQFEPTMKDPPSNITNKKPQSAVKTSGVTANTTQQIMKGNSAQKGFKKTPGHTRTKSDQFYNRGSIKPTVSVQNQTKRQTATSTTAKALIEAHQLVNSRQTAANPSIQQTSKMTTGMTIDSSQPRRPVVGSAHHSKKPSMSSTNSNQQQQVTVGVQGSKKSMKEKYIELKAMYDDLLQRHYAQQKQFQYEQQAQINNNPIKLGPQLMGKSQLIGQQIDMLSQSSTTPRLTISNQISQQQLNPNPSNVYQNTLSQNLDVIPKSMIQVAKGSKSNDVSQLQQKAVQKLNLAQGQSRKAAQGHHKRSVSDGNEQLFKFKQQQSMQCYLYPQPSNQTLHQQTQQMTAAEETLVSNRQQPFMNTLQSTPYQQPTHQRRVSDDYLQKQKKAQLHVHLVPNQQSQQSRHNASGLVQTTAENVAMDSNSEPQKLQTVDFNIKSFLLEMRNKHAGQVQHQPEHHHQMNNGHDLINIVDEQQLYSYNPPSPNTSGSQHGQKIKTGKGFAMIIEENSPMNPTPHEANFFNKVQPPQLGTLDSSRRVSMMLADSQSQQNFPKPIIDFSKVLQKQQVPIQEIMNKPSGRAHSPTPDSQTKKSKKGVQHKRVKSDVPEHPRKQHIQPQTNYQQVFNAQTAQLATNSSKQALKIMQQSKNPVGVQSLLHTNSSAFYAVSDKNTPNKMTQKNQNFILQQKQNQFSQQLDSNDGESKIINVSVDLIKDGMGLDNSYLDDSNDAFDLPSKVKPQQQKPMFNNHLHQVDTKLAKKQQVIFSGNDSGNKRDKYKKMLSKYDNNNNIASSRIEAHAPIGQSKAGNHNRKYTFDAGLLGSSPNNNSCSPINMSPHNRFSINDKMKDLSKKQQVSSKVLMPSSPKQIVPKSKLKIQNFVQPVKKAQPNLITDKINAAPPNNSAVNTQESPRPSLISTQQNIKINLIMQQPLNTLGERIETQDSTVSDPGLSPRTRANAKLIRHIKRSFRQTFQPPNTTVDFYRIGKVLGKGAFGKVNLALHKLSGKFAAVKSINKQYLSEDAQTKKVMQEVMILKRTRHRNIVRLYEFFETQKHILFVIELCAGGDLLNYVRRRRRLKEDVAKAIFKQIIEGLSYCHSKQILHRDIKLDNILLDSEGEVKICDFGISKIVKKGEIMTEQCGTPAYIAPEFLRDKGYTGFAADIWSAGVVLYAMLYGTVPFKANNMSELQKLIMKAKYTLKDDISSEARDLLTSLLEKDPNKRITIDQILSHKWLSDVDENIELFTDQEKDYIKNEFTYNDADRYNRNETGNVGQEVFTEQMLDSTNNSLLKNITSKSVILAPFNSTKSDINEPALSESMQAMMQTKRCIKFAARVRDINKQYEKNNNAELDNGVYHKLEEEEAKAPEPKKIDQGIDSLQSSFNKESSIKSDDDDEKVDLLGGRLENKGPLRIKPEKEVKKGPQTELERLESLIIQQEDDLDNPYEEAKYGPNKRSPREQEKVSNQLEKRNNNILQTGQTLIIDDQVVTQIEAMGYPKDYIIKCLNNNDLNYATTGYFLLSNKHSLSL